MVTRARAGINKRTVEALIKAGAFDNFLRHRASLIASIELAFEFASNATRRSAFISSRRGANHWPAANAVGAHQFWLAPCQNRVFIGTVVAIASDQDRGASPCRHCDSMGHPTSPCAWPMPPWPACLLTSCCTSGSTCKAGP